MKLRRYNNFINEAKLESGWLSEDDMKNRDNISQLNREKFTDGEIAEISMQLGMDYSISFSDPYIALIAKPDDDFLNTVEINKCEDEWYYVVYWKTGKCYLADQLSNAIENIKENF